MGSSPVCPPWASGRKRGPEKVLKRLLKVLKTDLCWVCGDTYLLAEIEDQERECTGPLEKSVLR